MSAINSVGALIPPSVYGGILAERNYIAIVLICTEQFISVFAPLASKLLSFIQTYIRSGRDEDMIDSNSNQFSGDDSENIERGAPIVSKTYARFIDDKKSTLGTKSNIEKLEQNGFKKSRFLSKAFMKRNNIVDDDEDT